MIGIAAHASEFPCSPPEFQLTTPYKSIIIQRGGLIQLEPIPITFATPGGC